MPTDSTNFDPRERMIQDQLQARGITDQRILQVMEWLPRERFLPEEMHKHAYDDAAVPIGHGQTLSQPYMVALMTEQLQLHKDHRVLEIGTGSGYQTAILANLVSHVFTIERVKPLLDQAWEKLLGMGIRNVHYHFGDGTLGWADRGPYDRIILTAGGPHVPGYVMSQLVEGGICVMPVGPSERQQLVRLTRHQDKLVRTDICACHFVRLIGQDGWPS